MRHYLFIAGFFLTTCGSSTENTEEENNMQISEKPVASQVLITMNDLREKIFEAGSPTHFTDSCSFYFECDCCYGSIIFNADSTFYDRSFCIADEDFTSGTYVIEDSVLTLNYSGYWISKIYNWEYETDSTVIAYSITDTLVEPQSLRFSAWYCDNKLKLVDEENKYIALETDANYNVTIEELLKEGLIE